MKRLERRPDASPNSTPLARSARSFSGQKGLRQMRQALGALPPAPPSCRVANQGLEPSAARAQAAPKRAPPAPRSASQALAPKPLVRSPDYSQPMPFGTADEAPKPLAAQAPPVRAQRAGASKRRRAEAATDPVPRSTLLRHSPQRAVLFG